MYSNPAGHGVFILDRILRDPAMTAEWQRELRAMVGRVADMRAELSKRLERLAPGHDWAPIATQGPQSNARRCVCWDCYMKDIGTDRWWQGGRDCQKQI